MEVGVRELKAKLSEYLAAAQAGEDVVVTERGRPIVRLVALAEATLDRGIAEGWIEPARQRHLSPPLKLRAERSVLDSLDEDRGTR